MAIHTAPRLDEDLSIGDLPQYEDKSISYDEGDEARDNGTRAGHAAAALIAYARRTGLIHDEEPETAIGDLLGDLRHLCDALGLDFADLSDKGHRHYAEELHGA